MARTRDDPFMDIEPEPDLFSSLSTIIPSYSHTYSKCQASTFKNDTHEESEEIAKSTLVFAPNHKVITPKHQRSSHRKHKSRNKFERATNKVRGVLNGTNDFKKHRTRKHLDLNCKTKASKSKQYLLPDGDKRRNMIPKVILRDIGQIISLVCPKLSSPELSSSLFERVVQNGVYEPPNRLVPSTLPPTCNMRQTGNNVPGAPDIFLDPPVFFPESPMETLEVSPAATLDDCPLVTIGTAEVTIGDLSTLPEMSPSNIMNGISLSQEEKISSSLSSPQNSPSRSEKSSTPVSKKSSSLGTLETSAPLFPKFDSVHFFSEVHSQFSELASKEESVPSINSVTSIVQDDSSNVSSSRLIGVEATKSDQVVSQSYPEESVSSILTKHHVSAKPKNLPTILKKSISTGRKVRPSNLSVSMLSKLVTASSKPMTSQSCSKELGSSTSAKLHVSTRRKTTPVCPKEWLHSKHLANTMEKVKMSNESVHKSTVLEDMSSDQMKLQLDPEVSVSSTLTGQHASTNPSSVSVSQQKSPPLSSSVTACDEVMPPNPSLTACDEVMPPNPSLTACDEVMPPNPSLTACDEVMPPNTISSELKANASVPGTPQSQPVESVSSSLIERRTATKWKDASPGKKKECSRSKRSVTAKEEVMQLNKSSLDLIELETTVSSQTTSQSNPEESASSMLTRQRSSRKPKADPVIQQETVISTSSSNALEELRPLKENPPEIIELDMKSDLATSSPCSSNLLLQKTPTVFIKDGFCGFPPEDGKKLGKAYSYVNTNILASSLDILVLHQNSEAPSESPSSCSNCNIVFSSVKHCKYHQSVISSDLDPARHHNVQEGDVWLCPWCPLMSFTNEYLNKHKEICREKDKCQLEPKASSVRKNATSSARRRGGVCAVTHNGSAVPEKSKNSFKVVHGVVIPVSSISF